MKHSKVLLLPVFGLTLATQTACSSLVGESLFVGEDEGRFLISADRAGLEAWSDGMNGILTNGRISPDLESPHWQLRKQQTTARAFRVSKPGRVEK